MLTSRVAFSAQMSTISADLRQTCVVQGEIVVSWNDRLELSWDGGKKVDGVFVVLNVTAI